MYEIHVCLAVDIDYFAVPFVAHMLCCYLALPIFRYFCPECRITHLGDCRACDLGDPDNELDKKRICHECMPSQYEMGAEEEESMAPKRKRSSRARSGAGTDFLSVSDLDGSAAVKMELCK